MAHRRTHRSAALAVLALVLALTVPGVAQAKLKKAKDLGPTPVENDCLIYRGGHPCYYGLWSGRFVVDKHILNVGDVLTTTIQTYGGLYPAYSWSPPGAAGLGAIECPLAAPAPPKDGSPNYFTLSCTFRARFKTNRWVVFGPSMGLASSSYIDGDYYAIVSGASVSGRVLNGEGEAVKGARVEITGPEDVYAETDDAGFYEAIELTPGNYTIAIKEKGYCHDSGEALITSRGCRRSVRKHLGGTAEVNFRGLGKYAIFGKVRDEFKRGLAGVTIKATGLPGGETKDLVTRADGSYRIGFEGGATVTLTSQKGGLPYAFYYVVKPDKTPSTGQSADVTPNNSQRNVEVNWELDRRLNFAFPSGARTSRAPADGFSKYRWIGTLQTQHGDPAPNVAVQIDPLSTNPPGAICSPDDAMLWPTTFADGSVDTIGGFERTSDARGRVALEVFTGSTSGFFNFDVSRKTDLSQTSRAGVTFDFAAPTAITSGNQLVTLLASGGNKGLGLRPSPERIVEWFAGTRANAGFQGGGLDLMIVQAGGSRAVAFFPRGQGPAVGAGGVLGPAPAAYVLDPAAFINLRGLTTVPTLSEWSGGQPVTISRPDARTYGGWPVPARAGGSFGSCLDSATGGTSTFTVHSPVNLLLTDSAGKQLGVAADGTEKAEIDGIVSRNGDVVTIIAPAGSYKASLVGTGSGSVTIESDTPAGTSALRFSSKKGAKATISVPGGGGLGKLKFAGAKVTPIRGTPLAISGLPKSWREYRALDAGNAAVVDPSGKPVIGASVTTPGQDGELFRLNTDSTGSLSGFWPVLRKGRHTLTVSAPGYTTTKVQVLVKRAR